jgi:hypothetical protein
VDAILVILGIAHWLFICCVGYSNLMLCTRVYTVHRGGGGVVVML